MDPIIDLAAPLAARLWSIYSREQDGPHLIFPSKRSDETRISEQESKIMLCQVLEASPWFYSIETPTRETYIQSGKIGLSARIDVTVYATQSAADRMLSIELKAGLPPVEYFRKDFEKILRERVNGMWFHTMERTNQYALPTLFERMRRAIELVAEHAIDVHHSIDIALCLLDQRVLLGSRIELERGLEGELERVFASDESGWVVSGPGSDAFLSVSRSSPRTGRGVPGTRRKMLVYCPRLAADTWLHFSSAGESYMLRAYAGSLAGQAPWRQPDALTTSSFFELYAPAQIMDLPPGAPSVDKADEWVTIIHTLNHKLVVAGAEESS